MATTETTAPLDGARVANLAQHVRGVIEAFTAARNDNTEARELAQGASAKEVGVRTQTVLALAEFSQTQQLTENEVTAVAAKVVAGVNDVASQKAIQQFIGECKRAMHPKVRARVPFLVDLTELCWTNEVERKAADTSEPTPLRDVFKRKYHMMLDLFDAFVKDVPLENHPDVMAFCERRGEEQRTNITKVLKRLEGITKELVAFHKDFPVDDVGVCIDALQQVDAKQLRAARPQPKTNVVPLNVPKPPTKEVTSVPATTTVVNDTGAPEIEDESDPIEDMIEELSGVAA